VTEKLGVRHFSNHNDELIAFSDLLHHGQKQVTTPCRAEPGLSPITTARDEM
jgi:hypothetical protein